MTRLIALLAAAALNCHAGFSDLEALSLIESGGNDYAVGSAGEVSRYQILPRVWKSYTRSRDYRSRWLSTEVARRHVDTIRQRFATATGRSPEDFDLYVMWNAGFDYYKRQGFNPRRVHAVIRERAQRFVNLKRYDASTASVDTPAQGPWASGMAAAGVSTLREPVTMLR